MSSNIKELLGCVRLEVGQLADEWSSNERLQQKTAREADWLTEAQALPARWKTYAYSHFNSH